VRLSCRERTILVRLTDRQSGGGAGMEGGMAVARERAGIEPEQPTSRTEQASSAFVEGLREIRGIVRAVAYGGATPAEQSFLVFVRALTSPAAKAVADLQCRVLREFPGVRLEVDIDGLDDLGVSGPNDLKE